MDSWSKLYWKVLLETVLHKLQVSGEMPQIKYYQFFIIFMNELDEVLQMFIRFPDARDLGGIANVSVSH